MLLYLTSSPLLVQLLAQYIFQIPFGIEKNVLLYVCAYMKCVYVCNVCVCMQLSGTALIVYSTLHLIRTVFRPFGAVALFQWVCSVLHVKK